MPGQAAKTPDTRQINVKLPDDKALMLSRMADTICEGSKSNAVELLIDMYAGKILERALQEKEQEQLVAVQDVMRWRAPTLTRELIAFVSGMVRAGNVPEVAMQLAAVPPRLWKTWGKRGRNDRAAGNSTLYADWVTAIEKAEAECEAEDIARMRAHGRQSWQALAWRLERQYPDRYAQRKRIDGKVEHSLMPMIDWDRLSATETRTLVELLRKGSPDADEQGLSRVARPALELVPGDVVDVIEVEAEDADEVDAKPQP